MMQEQHATQQLLNAAANLVAFQQRVTERLQAHADYISAEDQRLLQEHTQQASQILQQFANRIERNTESIARTGLNKALNEHEQGLTQIHQKLQSPLLNTEQKQVETQKMFRWIGVKAHVLFAIVVLGFFGLLYWQYSSKMHDYAAIKQAYDVQLSSLQQASQYGQFSFCGKQSLPCVKTDEGAGVFEGGYRIIKGANKSLKNSGK